MRPINSILLISLLTILSKSHAQFDDYIDSWNSLETIQGQFDKNHTLFQQAKCNPCDYLIIVYKDYVQLLLNDPKEGKEDNVLAFEFNIIDSHFDQTIWGFDQQKFRLATKQDLNEVLERESNQGIQWKYELTLPIEGLIIKGLTSKSYQYLIPSITLLFSILIFIAFPPTNSARQQQLVQIPRRTPLISLLILAHLQHIILIEVIAIAIKYLIHEESFLTKSVWYVVFMIPFGFIILQILYIYDAIRMRFLSIFQKVQSARLKDISLLLVFIGGIYGIGIGVLFAHKGIWIYAYFAFYLNWQIGQSIFIKTYPYLKLTAYMFLLIAYQMFLSNYETLFWFEQLTRNQIVIFWGVVIAVFLIGSILQKFLIGIQIVNQVLFQESKNIEMSHPSSSKSTTQVNLES